MNVSEIADLLEELDIEIVDAEIAGADAELLAVLRAEREGLVTEGVALEEGEAEEAMALQADEMRADERMEAAYPDGLCPSAHRPGPCPRYGPESDACCRLA